MAFCRRDSAEPRGGEFFSRDRLGERSRLWSDRNYPSGTPARRAVAHGVRLGRPRIVGAQTRLPCGAGRLTLRRRVRRSPAELLQRRTRFFQT